MKPNDDSDDSDSDSGADASPPRYLAYLQLVRLPNVFTAIADILMGYLFTHDSLDPAPVFACLLASSTLLYMAGMVLNDVFDYEIDAKERPNRPLPSGRVSRTTASWLGFAMLFAGVLLGCVASVLAQDARCGIVAAALAAAVVGYDRVLKRTPLGPLGMGLCRFLNVLLGMSTAITLDPLAGDAAVAWSGMHYIAAAGIGVYIVGVTWFARKEAEMSKPAQLALGTLVMWAGIGLLAGLWNWSGELVGLASMGGSPRNWYLFCGVLAFGIGWRFVRAVFDPRPPLVQSAVRHGIFSLIALDAAVCAAARGMEPAVLQVIPWPVLILALLIPTMSLGRWVYST